MFYRIWIKCLMTKSACFCNSHRQCMAHLLYILCLIFLLNHILLHTISYIKPPLSRLERLTVVIQPLHCLWYKPFVIFHKSTPTSSVYKLSNPLKKNVCSHLPEKNRKDSCWYWDPLQHPKILLHKLLLHNAVPSCCPSCLYISPWRLLQDKIPAIIHWIQSPLSNEKGFPRPIQTVFWIKEQCLLAKQKHGLNDFHELRKCSLAGCCFH